MSKYTIKKDVFNLLEQTKFPVNSSRKNVAKTPIQAFALGTVNYRGQKFLGGKTKGASRYNKKFPELYENIVTLIKLWKPDFKYTTIQVNKNFASEPHFDKNNVGPSYILGLGDYTGGQLMIEGKSYDIKNNWKKFDGTKGHWVEPFEGTRYSLVFFTHTFKPPNPSLRTIKITKKGLYKNNLLVKSYTKMT
jgi:hypothetical protein